ncbi:hypothetical protein PR202_ga03553 [Eleusine coracana subsp. coracana]|uniref:Retrotransposon gag domain-containing protein n=1 Tax=Eleusine coracana subsp. coracana TaxID=191504 RepID=A0AAV5BMA3_ELECO|nr:hypothetical protein PR202_ga03553 [Eleusine coracana subsp. coracana]
MGTDRQITWDEFKDAFLAHYIPTGLVRRKAREVAALKQGNRSVEEYCEEFNRLALYASEQVDTPAKRKDRFLEGLSAELQERLNLNMGGSFAEFVNNAIVAEDGYRRVMQNGSAPQVLWASQWTPAEVPHWCTHHPVGTEGTSPPPCRHLLCAASNQHSSNPRYPLRSRVKGDFAHPSGRTLNPDLSPATTLRSSGAFSRSARTPRRALAKTRQGITTTTTTATTEDQFVRGE